MKKRNRKYLYCILLCETLKVSSLTTGFPNVLTSLTSQMFSILLFLCRLCCVLTSKKCRSASFCHSGNFCLLWAHGQPQYMKPGQIPFAPQLGFGFLWKSKGDSLFIIGGTEVIGHGQKEKRTCCLR